MTPETQALAALIGKAIGTWQAEYNDWRPKDRPTFADWLAARLIERGVRGPDSPDPLREAAQAVVDALPYPLRLASDGGPIIDTLTARSPEIAALRAAIEESR